MRQKLASWWRIGQPVWISLSVGYAWILFSFVYHFEVPSSGAVLLALCVVAELRLSSSAWVIVGDHIINEPVSSRGPVDAPVSSIELDVLRPFATRGDDPNPDWWSWSTAVARDKARRFVQWPIGISAIVGSLLWGYGHLWF